jgi:GNAT superfamily N-acetyltransferase
VHGELRLRPLGHGDEAAVRGLFFASRAETFTDAQLSPEALQSLLNIQFDAQCQHYARHFFQSRTLLLLEGAKPVGRLIVQRNHDELLLVDMLVDPSTRRRGLGSWMLRRVADEARHFAIPLRCHVDPTNPARQLYQRMGFVVIGQDGVDQKLELV